MAGGKGSGVDGVDKNPVGGHTQAPTVRLRRTTEVPPTGVGIRALGHPSHRRRLRSGGTGAAEDLCTDPLTEPRRGNTKERGHTPTGETCGTGPT